MLTALHLTAQRDRLFGGYRRGQEIVLEAANFLGGFIRHAFGFRLTGVLESLAKLAFGFVELLLERFAIR